MNKIANSVLSGALAVSMSAFAFIPAQAAPGYVPQKAESNAVKLVQFDGRDMRRFDGDRARHFNGPPRFKSDNRGRFERRGNNFYFNGYRGYDGPRPGYREHNGVWFPLAAFAAGAIITGAIVNQQQPRYVGNAHVEWCYDRYRSYRAYDNTYQPLNGPRRQCYSPYN